MNAVAVRTETAERDLASAVRGDAGAGGAAARLKLACERFGTHRLPTLAPPRCGMSGERTSLNSVRGETSACTALLVVGAAFSLLLRSTSTRAELLSAGGARAHAGARAARQSQRSRVFRV